MAMRRLKQLKERGKLLKLENSDDVSGTDRDRDFIPSGGGSLCER